VGLIKALKSELCNSGFCLNILLIFPVSLAPTGTFCYRLHYYFSKFK